MYTTQAKKREKKLQTSRAELLLTTEINSVRQRLEKTKKTPKGKNEGRKFGQEPGLKHKVLVMGLYNVIKNSLLLK